MSHDHAQKDGWGHEWTHIVAKFNGICTEQHFLGFYHLSNLHMDKIRIEMGDN